MARDILYIQDGSLIDAAWTGHIVISNDNINWNGISKIGLSAGKHAISINNSSTNSHPEAGAKSGYIITLKYGIVDGPVIKFNPENVLNQPSWSTNGTAVDLTSGGITAIRDILTWLG